MNLNLKDENGVLKIPADPMELLSAVLSHIECGLVAHEDPTTLLTEAHDVMCYWIHDQKVKKLDAAEKEAYQRRLDS